MQPFPEKSQSEIREEAIADNEAVILGIAHQIARLKQLIAGQGRQETIELLEQAQARLQREVNSQKAAGGEF